VLELDPENDARRTTVGLAVREPQLKVRSADRTGNLNPQLGADLAPPITILIAEDCSELVGTSAVVL